MLYTYTTLLHTFPLAIKCGNGKGPLSHLTALLDLCMHLALERVPKRIENRCWYMLDAMICHVHPIFFYKNSVSCFCLMRFWDVYDIFRSWFRSIFFVARSGASARTAARASCSRMAAEINHQAWGQGDEWEWVKIYPGEHRLECLFFVNVLYQQSKY